MSDILTMKPTGLLRRLRPLASRNGWDIDVQQGGSHSKITMHGRRTVVPRHPSDLKTATFHGILKQLGVSETDLHE